MSIARLIAKLDRVPVVFPLLVLVLGHLTISAVRFNRSDRLVALLVAKVDRVAPRLEGRRRDLSQADNLEYEAFVRFARGQGRTDVLRQPFSGRVFVPLLASVLPFKANTAINTVNLAASLITMGLLFLLSRRMGASSGESLVGCALYVFSFPTFYYVTIGYIEPGLLLFLTLGCLSLMMDRLGWALIALVCGALARETMVLFLVPFLVHLLVTKRRPVAVATWLSAAVVGFGLMLLLARSTVGLLGGAATQGSLGAQIDPTSYWSLNLRSAHDNFVRPEFWGLAILTLGLPAWFSVSLLKPAAWRQLQPLPRAQALVLLSGAASAAAVFGYAVLVAYADGRFLWCAYPFIIPFVVLLISQKRMTSIQQMRGRGYLQTV